MIREAVTSRLSPELVEYVDGLGEARSPAIERIVREHRDSDPFAEFRAALADDPQAALEGLGIDPATDVDGRALSAIEGWLVPAREAEERRADERRHHDEAERRRQRYAGHDVPTERECIDSWGEDRRRWPPELRHRYSEDRFVGENFRAGARAR